MGRFILGFLLAVMGLGAVAMGEEQKACRSVHLWYKAPVGVGFYNEVVVEQSAGGDLLLCLWVG
ncbi:MAG TPA: hypothetical protein VGQ99_19015 [Tepidisphaeraceae bacterium]|nr:hypothetical protein [Tepidisphaeraceae bacterium]